MIGNDGAELDLASMQALISIVDSCRERWCDPAAWQRHLLGSALNLTRSRRGVAAIAVVGEKLHGSVFTWPEQPGGLAGACGCVDSLLEAGDAALNRCGSGANSAGVEECGPRRLVSVRLLESSGPHLALLAVERDPDEDAYERATIYRFRALHRLIVPMIGTRLAIDGQRGVHRLPPRCVTTLTLLLGGATEKEIAASMSRSVDTIHEHVRTIYSRFGVSSRAELLAYFIRRRPEGDNEGSR